jgi:hypothetical protein
MMAEPRAKVAWQALQQAKANASHATPVEQALIGALAARYPDARPLDPLNEGPFWPPMRRRCSLLLAISQMTATCRR